MQELAIKMKTVTSLELVTEINIFRKQDGNNTDLRHSDLLRIIRDEFEEEIAERNISLSEYTDSTNRKLPMFILTITQATQVLVRESKFVRRAVIAKLENSQQPKELSRKDLALMVIQAEEENERLQAQVKKLEPKAEYADKVLSSKDLLVTTVIAGDLGMSAIKMNRELRDRGIIRKVGGQWQLTAKYCDKGYATTRIHVREDKQTGEIHNDRLLVWTEYGKAFIHSLFNKNLSFSKSSSNSVSTTYRQPSLAQ